MVSSNRDTSTNDATYLAYQLPRFLLCQGTRHRCTYLSPPLFRPNLVSTASIESGYLSEAIAEGMLNGIIIYYIPYPTYLMNFLTVTRIPVEFLIYQTGFDILHLLAFIHALFTVPTNMVVIILKKLQS